MLWIGDVAVVVVLHHNYGVCKMSRFPLLSIYNKKNNSIFCIQHLLQNLKCLPSDFQKTMLKWSQSIKYTRIERSRVNTGKSNLMCYPYAGKTKIDGSWKCLDNISTVIKRSNRCMVKDNKCLLLMYAYIIYVNRSHEKENYLWNTFNYFKYFIILKQWVISRTLKWTLTYVNVHLFVIIC